MSLPGASIGCRGRLILLAPLLALLLGCTSSRAQSDGISRMFAAGWNLIAAPAGSDLSAARGPLYTMQAGDTAYQALPARGVAAGLGYWAFFPAATTLTLGAGAAAGSTVTVTAPAGQYVMVGNPSGRFPASVGGADVVYSYDPTDGYHRLTAADTLPPGAGAWAFSFAGGAIALTPVATAPIVSATSASPTPPAGGGAAPPHGAYPLHTRIVATVFWVGEIFDPHAADGSQVLSAYDDAWQAHYGGCDGVVTGGRCETVALSAANGYFPTAMTPRENPFYLDLPYNDFSDDGRHKPNRTQVIPWARGLADPGDGVSLMKNRWVQLQRDDRTCYGQIEDAGPGQYDDVSYVFGADDRRPLNARFNHAGMDVSPALRDCLGFQGLDNDQNTLDWRFIEAQDVPDGPWRRLVTTSPVFHPQAGAR